MTIQQEFKAAAIIAEQRAEKLVRKACPGATVSGLLSRLTFAELMTMRNAIADLYVEMIETAAKHVDPKGKKTGIARTIEQAEKAHAIEHDP